jgi:putative restriction endonuclease
LTIYVGLTDWDWYQHLASRRPQEVNYWRPSAQGAFAALSAGELFLFKLHAPRRAIVGGGFFVKYTRLPLSLSWMAFEQNNGARDLDSLRGAILRYRERRGLPPEPDPEIGNIILTQPFFFPEAAWIPEPPGWSPTGIQEGKKYASESGVGAWLWSEVVGRLANFERFQEPVREGASAERVRAWALRRIGQGGFRVLVTDAYGRRCAVTGEHTLPVLEAAHIRPVAKAGNHDVRNGLLLRADLHILFDRGYVTLDEDYRFVVSPRLENEYHNGRDYYARMGQRIFMPASANERPAPELLEWHREHVFVA